MSSSLYTTGFKGLDNLLEGLKAHDTIVFHCANPELYSPFLEKFPALGAQEQLCLVYTRMDDSLDEALGGIPFFDLERHIKGKELCRNSDFPADALNQFIEKQGTQSYYISLPLGKLKRLLKNNTAIGELYQRLCEHLYSIDIIASWLLVKNTIPDKSLAFIQDSSQIVLDVGGTQEAPIIQVRKALGRYSERMYWPHYLNPETGEMTPIMAEGPTEAELLTYLSKKVEEMKVLRDERQRYMDLDTVAFDLAQHAFVEGHIPTLLEHSVSTIAKALDADSVAYLEQVPDENVLKLKAGVGWGEGLVGHATVEVGTESLAGALLSCAETVTMHDFSHEGRFAIPALLSSHRILSGLLALIRKQGGAWGLIGVFSTRKRKFAWEERSFLKSMAYLFGAVLDQAQYQQSRDRLAFLVSSSEDAIVGMDLDGNILSWNEGAERLTGYSAEEVLGRSPDILVPSDRLHEKDIMFDKIKRGERIEDFETVRLRKDGTQIQLLLCVSPIHDASGGLVGFSGVAKDITARKQAEEFQRKRAQQIIRHQSALLELTKLDYSDLDGAIEIIIEADAKTLDIERVGVWILSEDHSQLICKSLYLRTKGIHEKGMHLQADNNPTFFKALEETRVWATDDDAYSDLWTSEFKKEYLIPHGITSIMVAPIRLQGNILGIVCHDHTGSERKWEVEEKDFAGDIANQVALAFESYERREAQTALRAMEKQLWQVQKMEVIGTLAGGITHDFNNILSGIIAYAELAQMHLTEVKQVDRYLQQVLTAGLRAKGLVRQILTLSRRSEGERRPIRLHKIIEEAMQLLQASLTATIQVRWVNEATEDTILADPTQVHQVVMNLCTNAQQAMRPNGGSLEIKLENVMISPEEASSQTSLMPGRHVRLEIRDTGHGMEPAVLERIFDPFYSTKGPEEGTGLGLSVVRGIITSYGGRIRVQSAPGQGTAFQIDFPCIEWPADRDPDPESPPPRGSGHILFVDDEATLAYISQQGLVELGYDVEIRTNATEALQTFRENPDRFDVVITDQTMPFMTGEELAKELFLIRPNLPVILCTGFSPKIPPEKAKALGIRAYLMKPMGLRDLAQTLQRILAEKTLAKN